MFRTKTIGLQHPNRKEALSEIIKEMIGQDPPDCFGHYDKEDRICYFCIIRADCKYLRGDRSEYAIPMEEQWEETERKQGCLQICNKEKANDK